jgi:imidazolonepropionase-like amidohydrolase
VPTFAIYSRDKLPSDSALFNDDRLKYIPPSVQQKWHEAVKQQIGTPDEVREFNKLFAGMLESLGKMHKAGVPLLAGTDVGWYNTYSYPGFELHYELQLLVRSGLTPLEALQTATINPARFFGNTTDLGTIAEGKLADMVLLTANPLEDIRNTQKIDAVFVNGRALDRKQLDSLLLQAENAVKNK